MHGVSVCVCVSSSCLYIHIYIYIYMSVCVYIYIYICIYTLVLFQQPQSRCVIELLDGLMNHDRDSDLTNLLIKICQIKSVDKVVDE
jgi:hypothetical protein